MTRPVWLGPDRGGWDHVRIPDQLVTDPRVGPNEVAAYVSLAKHASVRSGDTTVSQATISRHHQMSAKPVRSGIKTLVRLGYAAEIRQGRKILAYRLLPPPPLAAPMQMQLDCGQPVDAVGQFDRSHRSIRPTNKDLEQEIPPTPASGGDNVINFKGRKRPSRADGTNPRAVAAKKLEDQKRRIAECTHCSDGFVLLDDRTVARCPRCRPEEAQA